jgi:hypothetical protein
LLAATGGGALALELLDDAAAAQRGACALAYDFCLARVAGIDATLAAWDAAAAAALLADGGDGGGGGGDALPPAARVLLLCLRHLRAHAPALFASCQAAALPPLRAAFARRFAAALEGGGGSGGGGGAAAPSRPIDLHAHDPPRYAGDMLAWVHLALAELREALLGLFGADADRTASLLSSSAAAAAADDDATTPPLTTASMLAEVSSGVARPLCARLEAAAAGLRGGASGAGAGAAQLRILDVVCFYEGTLGALLRGGGGGGGGGGDAPLLAALARTRGALAAALLADVGASAGAYAAGGGKFAADLGASAAVVAGGAAAADLLRAAAAALAPGAAMAALGGAGAVLDALLPPLLAGCRAGAEGLRLGDTATYMVNNVAALRAALAPHAEREQDDDGAAGGAPPPPVRGWLRRLDAETEEWEKSLVQQAANDMLAATGLLAVLHALARRDGAGDGAGGAAAAAAAGAPPRSAQPGFTPAALAPVLRAVDAQAAAADASGLFARVAAPASRARLRRAVLQVLAAGYARVYAEVRDPAARYDAAAQAALLQKTPAQVEAMLDLR